MTRRMISAGALLALLLVCCGWVSAQTVPPPPLVPAPPVAVPPNPAPGKTDPEKIYGLDNGRAWRTWSATRKIFYVSGFANALISVDTFLTIPTYVRKDLPLVDPKCGACYLFPGKYTNGEVVEMLDKLFEAPENRVLSIGDALAVLAMRQNGMPREEVDKQIDSLRQVALMSK